MDAVESFDAVRENTGMVRQRERDGIESRQNQDP